MTPTPVISYARISADTEKDAHGVQAQHKFNRETARRLGWTIVAEISDNDKSASKSDVYREGFESLIKALAKGRTTDGAHVAGVVVHAQDRVARRFSDWERFTDALTVEPGRVIALAGSARDPYSDGFMWEGAAGMVGAKSEPRKIAKRTKDSHRSRAERGKTVGGMRPFGWMPDRVTLDEKEAKWAREAVADFVAGRTLNSIVRRLRENGIKTVPGNEWTASSLRQYLDNPRLCGWRRLNGEIVTGSDGEPVKGEWQPIVTPAEWLACAERLKNRSRSRIDRQGHVVGPLAEDHGNRRYLLSGFLRCGKLRPNGAPCMAMLRVRTQKDCNGHMYTCPPAVNGGCAGIGRNGARIETFVVEAVLSRLEAEAWEKAGSAGVWEKEAEWEKALAARAALVAAWDNGQGIMSNETFFELLGKSENLIKSLRAERDRHAAAVAQAASLPDNVRKEWEAHANDLGWRRSIIARAIHSVIVYPVPKGTKKWVDGSVVIHWRE